MQAATLEGAHNNVMLVNGEPVNSQALGDDFINCMSRIQTRGWVLENDLGLSTEQFLVSGSSR